MTARRDGKVPLSTWRRARNIVGLASDKDSLQLASNTRVTLMPTNKNRDLQCLRALAIILVIMLHYRYRLPTPTAYFKLFVHFSPWTGVDIFFAISGLLICHSFLRDLQHADSPTGALTAFWIRRAGRLLPAVVFWVAVSVGVAAFAVHSPGADVRKVAISGIAAVLGVSNAFWTYCTQHGAAYCGHSDFNGVTWSLSLEWQLYAILTVLIVTVGRKWAVVVMFLAACFMSTFPAPQGFSIPWAFRMQAFTAGAATFLLLGKGENLPQLRLGAPTCVLLLVLGASLCVLSPTELQQPFVLPAVAVGALLCLLSTLSARGYSHHKIATPLVWIGERSYSIYLCHLPLILLTREILARTLGLGADPMRITIGFAVAASLVAICSDLSYRFIEVPFQHISRQYLARKKNNGKSWDNAKHTP